MGDTGNTLPIISREIKKLEKIIAQQSWLNQVEPLVMLSLVVSGAKPGATLPAWFTKKETIRFQKLLTKLKLAHQVLPFIPPKTGKKVWIIDVAKNADWLNKFNSRNISDGTYYGYPECCQRAFEKRRSKPPKAPFPLNFVGLVPCRPRCANAMALALAYKKVITNVLSPIKFSEFRSFWEKV